MADACTAERMFMLVGVSRRDLLGFLLFLYFYFRGRVCSDLSFLRLHVFTPGLDRCQDRWDNALQQLDLHWVVTNHSLPRIIMKVNSCVFPPVVILGRCSYNCQISMVACRSQILFVPGCGVTAYAMWCRSCSRLLVCTSILYESVYAKPQIYTCKFCCWLYLSSSPDDTDSVTLRS